MQKERAFANAHTHALKDIFFISLVRSSFLKKESRADTQQLFVYEQGYPLVVVVVVVVVVVYVVVHDDGKGPVGGPAPLTLTFVDVCV